jgi:glycosyltransferase involved in cell wall biosynthesis
MAFYRHFAEREDFEVAVATDNPEVHEFPGVFPLTFFSPPSWLERLKRTRFHLWAHAWQHLMAGRHVPPAVVNAAVQFRPDVIMTVAGSWSWATDVAAVLSRRLGVPLVGSFNDWFDYSLILAPPFRPVLERKFRRFYLSCDLALCTSEGMREALGPHPNAIIHYPMGAERKEQIAKHRDRGDRPLRILYGGSVAQWYGQMLEEVVTLARETGRLGRDIEFVICGALPSWSTGFDQWARESGIYLGQVPFAELQEQAEASDALLVLMGFGAENEQVERTSFKTKFLDYLSFDRPICVWGPIYSSAVRTAREFDSAEVCDSPSAGDCLAMLLAFARNTKRSGELVANAGKMYEARFHPARSHSLFLEECRKLSLRGCAA